MRLRSAKMADNLKTWVLAQFRLHLKRLRVLIGQFVLKHDIKRHKRRTIDR